MTLSPTAIHSTSTLMEKTKSSLRGFFFFTHPVVNALNGADFIQSVNELRLEFALDLAELCSESTLDLLGRARHERLSCEDIVTLVIALDLPDDFIGRSLHCFLL